jgi:hypothetical protein
LPPLNTASWVTAETRDPGKFTRACALANVKVLMPKVAPLLELSDFTTLKKCSKSNWVDEMKAIEIADEQEEMNPRLLFDS